GSTHLVTSVTVKTTSCLPPVVVPVSVNCWPGTRGRNLLSTRMDLAENRETEKSFAPTWAGGVTRGWVGFRLARAAGAGRVAAAATATTARKRSRGRCMVLLGYCGRTTAKAVWR